MQLLAHLEIADYDTWRQSFDGDAEARGTAGLTLLQLWRPADGGQGVWMLYEVADRARADAYLDGLGRLHAGQGGATERGRYYLDTA